jgi:hypothetical protein
LVRSTQTLFFTASPDKETEVSINHLSYPGISLYVDSQRRDYANDSSGRIATTLTKGSQKIEVKFEDTTAIKTGKLISLFSLVVFLLLLL